MTETEDMKLCEDLLHRHGLKNTRTRREVLRLLRQCGGVLTAEDISRTLVEEGKKPDFSTLYRILELFTERGLAEKHYLPDLRKYGFSLKAAGHCHRLICLKCHRVIEIDHCPLESFEKELSEKTRFTITGHNLEWYGCCPDCQAAEAEKSAVPERRSGKEK